MKEHLPEVPVLDAALTLPFVIFLRPWAAHLLFMHFRFLTCKVRIMLSLSTSLGSEKYLCKSLKPTTSGICCKGLLVPSIEHFSFLGILCLCMGVLLLSRVRIFATP